jgi:hypothetical protein
MHRVAGECVEGNGIVIVGKRSAIASEFINRSVLIFTSD